MFDYSKVDEVIRRIINASNPKMIIVFGSVARREAKDHSDLGLLVIFDVMESQKNTYALLARQFIGLKLPFDLIVMNYNDFIKYKDRNHSFVHEIATTGEIVYAQRRFSKND